METKIIFVKTSRGENEMHSPASLLSGDIRRALMMVDGTSTFAEIQKHAAPSLRNQLMNLMEELKVRGYIHERSQVLSVPKPAAPPKTGFQPVLKKPNSDNEFDFTSAFRPPTPEVLAAEEAKAALLTAQLKQQQSEAVRLQAEKEAALAKAEAERAKQLAAVEMQARIETERRAQEMVEQIRRQAELDAAAKLRVELEAAQVKAAAEMAERLVEAEKAKQAAELRARQLAEIARLKAKQAALEQAQAQEKAALEAAKREAEKARAAELEKEMLAQKLLLEQAAAEHDERQAKVLAELKAKVLADRQSKVLADREAQALAERQDKELLERQAKKQAEQQIIVTAESAQTNLSAPAPVEATLPAAVKSLDEHTKLERTDPSMRTTTVTVLFFDMVAYSKQSVHKQTQFKKLFNQLVSLCLKSLDESDSEFIILDTGDGAAVGFMQHPEDALEAAMHFRRVVTTDPAYSEMRVRMGIHLGPINIVTDMNGKPNMVGSGINDAQRVMDFAGSNQIFISRSYFDFVSRLSDEYEDLFRYRGVRKDKHGYEHPVYELIDPIESPTVRVIVSNDSSSKVQLEPVLMANLPSPVPVEIPKIEIFTGIELEDAPFPVIEEVVEVATPVRVAKELAEAEAAKFLAEEKTRQLALIQEIEERRRVATQEAEVKKLADSQAKAWKHAERRALESAKVNAERVVQQDAAASATKAAANAPTLVEARPAIAWGKWAAGLVALLLVAFMIALYVVPMVVPMHDYEAKAEQLLSEKLQLPVRIGSMSFEVLPAPQVTFHELYIGQDKSIRAQQVTVDFALLKLFSAHKLIHQVNIDGLRVSVANVKLVHSWLQNLPADDEYPIEKISLARASVDGETFNVSDIGGGIHFNSDGKMLNAELHAVNGKISASITTKDKQSINISVKSGAFPFLPKWTFDELRATGEFKQDSLVLSQIGGQIAGGFLAGRMTINWHTGWTVEGSAEAEQLLLQKFTRSFEGTVKGEGSFRMQSPEFKGLVSSTIFSGKFMANKGQVRGFDMVEVVRTHGGEPSLGGRTSFDDLNGVIAYSANNFQFKQLQLHRGALVAEGEVAMSQQKVLGSMKASIKIQSSDAPMMFLISGTEDHLEARAQ